MANPLVVIPKAGEVRFEDHPIAQPGTGEVTIRTRRTMISTGTELTILAGQFPAESAWADYGRYPFRAGYSAAGEVFAVGEGVTGLSVGDRVAAPSPHARFATVSSDLVTPVPDERVPLEQVPFGTLGQTVMNGVRRSGAGWGDAVVVFGAGLLGQLAVRFCRLVGARPVIAVDVARDRLDRLPRDEAIVPVDAANVDVPTAVAEATRGRMADVVFEVTGNPELIPAEFATLKPCDGRVVMLSSPRGPSSFDFHDLCNRPSHTIIGAHIDSQPERSTAANPWTGSRNSELFFDLIAAGELDLGPLITHRRGYRATPDAYLELLEDRSHALAVILDWDDDPDA
jgi:2-desacetyl-2-hydroxyethyl bacteriochlorophyllide A dehydrogenase